MKPYAKPLSPRTKTLTPKAPVILRPGRDEMNLAEYPFATLRHQALNGAVIEKHWPIPHPTYPGRELEAGWRVTGDPELGLPTSSDERLYLVLMELTREAGWHQTVHFSPAQVLQRLRSEPNSRAYTALRQGLARLKAMSVTARHCFWDNSGRRLLDTVGFSVIDDYTLDLVAGRKKTGMLPLSSWKWSDVIFASMQSNYVRPIDLDFALSLERPLALRLYRYLDKKRYSKAGPRSGYAEGLVNLCDKHLGLADTRFPSAMKRTLEPVHEELLSRGFLKSAEFQPLASGIGLKVVYRFGDKIWPKGTVIASGAMFVPQTSSPNGSAPGPSIPNADSNAGVGAPLDAWTLRCRACDAVIERVKVEDPEEHRIWVDEGLEDLGPADRDRLNRNPESPLVANALWEHMRCMSEIAFAWMVEEEKSRLLLEHSGA